MVTHPTHKDLGKRYELGFDATRECLLCHEKISEESDHSTAWEIHSLNHTLLMVVNALLLIQDELVLTRGALGRR